MHRSSSFRGQSNKLIPDPSLDIFRQHNFFTFCNSITFLDQLFKAPTAFWAIFYFAKCFIVIRGYCCCCRDKDKFFPNLGNYLLCKACINICLFKNVIKLFKTRIYCTYTKNNTVVIAFGLDVARLFLIGNLIGACFCGQHSQDQAFFVRDVMLFVTKPVLAAFL